MAWEFYTSFSSSNIATLKYENIHFILEVGFHNGSAYQYYDIPYHVWEALKSASSQGEYLAAHIKGYYRYSRV